jgi:hypothetical protein
MRILFILLACLPGLEAEIIDRIALTVDGQVITETQIDEELRVTAFLNREPVVDTVEKRRAIANQLARQVVIRGEMDVSHYAQPDPESGSAYLEKLIQTFGGNSNFDSELKRYQLTREALLEHLAFQMATLRFIEYRFRPDFNISDADIRASYQTRLETWKRHHLNSPPPSLEQDYESIRESLIQSRTDEILTNWLEQRLARAAVVFVDKSLH